jgi:tetrahydromethanopterin S-methyltransferase subunit C
MASAVYGIATSDAQAVRIATRLKAAGFMPDDISILAPDRAGTRELGTDNVTKAPEGAATGAGTGAVLGGALGWLAGIGALAIPGLGPLIAAGPILAALSGAAVGGTVGGLTGALIGMGIPEYEAKQYEAKLRSGNVLMCVHAENSEETALARQIMSEEKAEDISTGSEAAARSSS